MDNKWKRKLDDWKDKMKKMDAGQKKNRLMILFLCGLLLLVVVVPIPESEKNKEKKNTSAIAVSEGENRSGSDDLTGYEIYLEQKTAQALREVEGAGEVTVMITLKSTGQKVVEKDQQSSGQTTKESDSQGGTRENEEKSLDKTTVYSQGTDGTQTPYISKENAPEVEGVLVIAEGGDNAVVVKNLTEAVQALFGVEAHKIKIMKRAVT